MKRKPLRELLVWTIAVIWMAVFLTGCGGGGSSGSSTSTGDVNSAAKNGSVALFLADGPDHNLEELWLHVTKVSLLPSGNRKEVILFHKADGFPVNILDYQNEDFLLTLKGNVPAGYYEKIRLEVSKIDATGGPCDDLFIKLPSEKVDLNPRKKIHVAPGETLGIRLDVDVKKSAFKLHQAGNSGKCIFQPVMFVTIDKKFDESQRCPKILKGFIEELIIKDTVTEGFILNLAGDRGRLRVYFDDPVYVFDESGYFTHPSALEPGQRVLIRGNLTKSGCFLASLVVIGDVLRIQGTVEGRVLNDVFPLTPGPDEELTGGMMNVAITSQTVILRGGDEEVGPNAIFQGLGATVIGKFFLNDQIFRAVAVFLESKEVTGKLVSVEPETGGSMLGVEVSVGNVVEFFLPQDQAVYLVGDGEIDILLLDELTECGTHPEVRIIPDPNELQSLAAKKVFVFPEKVSGEVQSIDPYDRIIVIETESGNKTIEVRDGAFIFRCGESYGPIFLWDIKTGEDISAFGFTDCLRDDIDSLAFMVVVDKWDDKDEDHDDDGEECNWVNILPHLVRDNNVKICLESGFFENNLTVNGNNFTLIGDSYDNHWTIISGNVTINGNNATFKKIKFTGKINENGNNTSFINCRF